MNKLTKGTIAAGAGVVLLLGVGGTLAYWNDTANLAGETGITAGQLSVTQSGTPTWQIQHTTGAPTPVTDITAVRIVPGDQLIYTGDYTITAQGQNLAYEVAAAAGAIAPATPGDPADEALAGQLAAAATFAVDGTPVTPGTPVTVPATGDNTLVTTPAVITATITWPFGDGTSPDADNPAQQGVVDLSEFALTVTQVDGN